MAPLLGRSAVPVPGHPGTEDAIVGPRRRRQCWPKPSARGPGWSSWPGGPLPQARDPVKVNLLIREFVDAARPGPASGLPALDRGRSRPKRALYISSPIGLGHARRDIAIADELRRLHPGLEIDWLAQHPVTTLLRGQGERIHPASRAAGQRVGSHRAPSAADHDLHCFQAWRRMDEILLANFMVFHDIVETSPTTCGSVTRPGSSITTCTRTLSRNGPPYAWLTDFVGWLPMPDGGQHEAYLTADYNAEMIEHIARYPRVRDRAIFVGAPDDIVPDRFGPGLPGIRAWTEAHYDFSGDYITGFDPAELADREAIRAELGYATARQGLHRDRRGFGRGQRNCCAGSSTRSPQPSAPCLACA